MSYEGLKAMIESLINTYKCPECSSKVIDNDVDIVGAAGNTVNIDIECSKCKKHSMIKAEVLAVDLGHLNITKENMDVLKENLRGLATKGDLNLSTNSGIKAPVSKKIIKDVEITELNKNLKADKLKVSDLFGDT